MKPWQAGIASTVLGLAIWQAIVVLGDLPKFILPGPGLVAETLWKSRETITENAIVTLSEVLVGLVLGAILGGLSAIGAIIGEWVGASKGLGYLMLLANGRAKIDLMFAALIVLAILTLCLHAAVDMFCRRFLDRQA